MEHHSQIDDNGSRAGAGLFRGWRVVAGLFVAGMMIYGAGLYGFTLMVPPLSQEFGWSHAATGALVSVFWLAAPLTPLGGACIRRFGPVALIATAILLEGICLALVGLVDGLAAMYVLRFLMGTAKVMMMAGVTAQAARWFSRRFGMAVAICFAGWHFGGLIIAPSTQVLIDQLGWRQACFVLGLVIPLVGLPALMMSRGKPADFGMLPDGDPAEQGALDTSTSTASATFGFRRILVDPAFWLIALITVFGSFTYAALLTQEVALITTIGLPPTHAASAIGVTAGMAIAGALLFGTLVDRYGFVSVMTGNIMMMMISVAGMLWSLAAPNAVVPFTSAICFGFAIGGFDTCIVAELRARYGPIAFVDIFGPWYFFYLATLFGAPILAGALVDRSGSYEPGLWTMLALLVAAILAILALGFLRADGSQDAKAAA